MLTRVASSAAARVSMKSVPPEAVPISATVAGLSRATSASNASSSVRLCRGRMNLMAGENTLSRAAPKPETSRSCRIAFRHIRYDIVFIGSSTKTRSKPARTAGVLVLMNALRR